MAESSDPQEERAEAYDFRRFLLRTVVCYDLASTPPVASIWRYSQSKEDRESGPCDWELELSRQAQLRRGIDLKHIFQRFLVDLSANHGEKRADQFMDWVLNGGVNRVSPVRRGQIYEDRNLLIQGIKNGGYRRGDWD